MNRAENFSLFFYAELQHIQLTTSVNYEDGAGNPGGGGAVKGTLVYAFAGVCSAIASNFKSPF